jgi:hypothetical protein
MVAGSYLVSIVAVTATIGSSALLSLKELEILRRTLWPTSGLHQRQGLFRRLPSGSGVILHLNRRGLLVS